MNDDHGGIVQYFEKLADVEVKKNGVEKRDRDAAMQIF